MTDKVTVSGWKINLTGRGEELAALQEQLTTLEQTKPMPIHEIRAMGMKILRCKEKINTLKCKIEAAETAWSEQKDTFEQYKDDAMAFVHLYDLHWIGQGNGTYMACVMGNWRSLQVKSLKFQKFDTQNPDFLACVDDIMLNENRKFLSATFSWNTPHPDSMILNMMRPDMCPMVEGTPHPIFETLIESLGGGKKENILQLKKILLSKWLYPDNPFLPAIVISDPCGDAGKGLFSHVFAKTFFGQHMAITTNMQALVGKFNDSTRGLAFVGIDEKTGGESDDPEALKRLLANPTTHSERKYESQIQVDNTAMYFFASNRVNAVKLEGTRVDRRYQIMKTHKKLTWYLKHGFLKHLDSEADCDHWIKNTGQNIIKDRTEMGKWIYATLASFAEDPSIDLRNVDGDFGEDYQSMLESQKPYYHSVFETIFTEPNFKYIERRVLYDIYVWANKHDNDGDARLRRGRFFEEAVNWCKLHNLDITSEKVYMPKKKQSDSDELTTSMRVFTIPRTPGLYQGQFDFDYVDNSKRWVIYWGDEDAKMSGIKALKISID